MLVAAESPAGQDRTAAAADDRTIIVVVLHYDPKLDYENIYTINVLL